ncbi:Stk1 family PASTA domain-containing Ser/Thr kinase [Leucobacter sp. USHLN153]|uniref:Stk1 family PASTA domain-containing Ser/Thr kinase n=1 Tax=Leucobacter sp. USHLN153 TaxID=3081268 RepID=UPI003019AE38
MTSVPTDPLIGQTLDERYAIRSRIARGGMAMVYLATDLRLERRVAVKVMHEHLAEDANFTRRFEQEARSAARLSHPNLVNVYDQGHDLGRTYLIMEYLPSITLRDLLKKQRRLTAEETIEISTAILSGLAAAHSAGIVHRDLKPENVMLADDGRIKLGDFGLARAVSANTTTGQALLGTIAYLSPELVTRGVADARSDLYAFGIMLYEMLTGSQPFTGEQPLQIAYQHAHAEVPRPSLESPEVSPAFDELVLWLTQRDPEARPADAAEALEALRAVERDEIPSGATRVLPQVGSDTTATPATTVLDPAQQWGLAAGDSETTVSPSLEAESAQAAPVTPIDRAAESAERRLRRGRIAAIVATLAVIAAGGAGWWFGQGPGSRVTIPEVAGLAMADAQVVLEDHSLAVSTTECPSLEVEAGLASETTPETGTRVNRGSAVELCQSTGPKLLPVPTLVGLDLDEAKEAVESAGFTVGDTEMRFGDDPADQVIAAVNPDGDALGDTYAEQAPISLIASAGEVPKVRGKSFDAATKLLKRAGLEVEPEPSDTVFESEVRRGHAISVVTPDGPLRTGDTVSLRASAGAVPDVAGLPEAEASDKLVDAGLTVDPELRQEAFDDSAKKGAVIALLPQTDPLRPGDPVGLQVSLGPELFPVPDVAGMGLQEAMDALSAAGFTPTTLVPDKLREFAKATKTDPAAGEEVPAGTEIQVRSTISL